MLETIPVAGKEITTFAKVTTSEDIHFYGELEEAYKKSFMKFKNDAGINELSPALSFLAHKGFGGYTADNYQKKEYIEETPTYTV